MSSEADMAYLAGLVDGEGTIRWSKGPVLRVSNTYEPLFAMLSRYGGSVHVERRYGREQERAKKTLWRWTITGWRAADLLEGMLPFLTIKHQQAEEILALWRAR